MRGHRNPFFTIGQTVRPSRGLSGPNPALARAVSPAGVSGRTEFDPVGQLPALGLHRAGRLPGAYPTGALSGVWSDPQSVARFSASLPALRVEPAVPGGLAVLDGRLGLRTLSPPLAPIRAGALNGASLDQRLCLWRGLSVSRCLEPISAERAS